MNVKEDFVKSCVDKIKSEILKDIDLDKIKESIVELEGVSDVIFNEESHNLLDMNYEFSYKQERYLLRLIAVNLDYSSGHYHAFPDVFQLCKKDELNFYPDNKRLTKRSKKYYQVMNEADFTKGESVNEYCETVPLSVIKKNNMPYIRRENIDIQIRFWLKRGLMNRMYFMLETESNVSNQIKSITKKFLDEKKIEYKLQYGVNNCKKFFFVKDKNNGKLLFSPLTYNGGGILKMKN